MLSLLPLEQENSKKKCSGNQVFLNILLEFLAGGSILLELEHLKSQKNVFIGKYSSTFLIDKLVVYSIYSTLMTHTTVIHIPLEAS